MNYPSKYPPPDSIKKNTYYIISYQVFISYKKKISYMFF
uniref:Uncharacterized protein n=1 Tax=Arabidopsis thaliana TaxID=3702 RepID=Q0WLX2_ARATH|nr:hypothetical protein [Arabidopsis thaliana]